MRIGLGNANGGQTNNDGDDRGERRCRLAFENDQRSQSWNTAIDSLDSPITL